MFSTLLTSTVLLLVLLLVLLAETKLGKEKFKMGSILSTDISFENSYFYGRKYNRATLEGLMN